MLNEYRERGLKIGLSMTPSNRADGIEAVKKTYIQANLPPPKLFVWLKDPLSGCLVASVFEQARDQVGRQVWNQIRNQISKQVWDQVGDQVGRRVWDQVRNQVWNQIGVMNQVRDQIRDQTNTQVSEQVVHCGYGSHDAAWPMFYLSLLEVCPIDACKVVLPFIEVAENVGYWWPYENVAILTEKPSLLTRDDEHRLHNADGKMAIQYPSGWGVYSYHGIRLPEKYGSTPTHEWKPEWILAEPNASIKAALIKGIGMSKFINIIPTVCLDKQDNGYQLLQ